MLHHGIIKSEARVVETIDKQEITETSAIEDMTDEELQQELDTLLVSQGYVKQ